jgi:NADH-quinone oxidoreductase subunit L
MTVPLILLGVASVVGGLVLNNWIGDWLHPATGGAPAGEKATGLLHFSLIGILTLIVVALGVVISVMVFGPSQHIPVTAPATRSPLTQIGRRDLYGDTINEAVFMRPGQQLTARLGQLDDRGIDGAVNGTADVIAGLSARMRRAQNGFVRTYALTMVAGAAVVGAVIAIGRLG